VTSSDRVRAILERVSEVRAPSAGAWPFPSPEPEDLASIYAMSDGLALPDGTTIFGRATLAETTRWLRDERALAWPEDLVVVGERDDLVIIRDLDLEGARAGGGVLEAPTDGLEGFTRVALDLLDHLERRARLPPHGERAPEIAADDAIAARDRDALARVVRRDFYPGAELARARAAMVLGEIDARSADDDAALEAFTIAVTARVHAARRGAETVELERAWRACARTCDDAGRSALAETCRRRSTQR
jgi:hypothetical protein